MSGGWTWIKDPSGKKPGENKSKSGSKQREPKNHLDNNIKDILEINHENSQH